MIKLNGQVVGKHSFPDGTKRFIKEDFDRINRGYEGNDITWTYEDDEEMVTVMFLKKHLDSLGLVNTTLQMPYIPNARMDRVKTKYDVFTLKYFADFINSLNFSSVVVADPHSYASELLINNLEILGPEEGITIAFNDIKEKYGEDIILFYPDEGAMKRYSSEIAIPYCFGVKNRDWETGKILGLQVVGDVESIKGKTVLIVDDICSRGGTFFYAAKELRALGAKNICLHVTHCENTIHEGELLNSGFINHIYTSDSILTKGHQKITIYNWEELYG